jgi:hypothetical protein
VDAVVVVVAAVVVVVAVDAVVDVAAVVAVADAAGAVITEAAVAVTVTEAAADRGAPAVIVESDATLLAEERRGCWRVAAKTLIQALQSTTAA